MEKSENTSMDSTSMEKIVMTDTLAAMFIIVDRKMQIQQIKVTGDMTLGSTRWANTVDVAVDSRILADLHGKIKKTEKSCVFQDVSKKSNTYYNGKLFGSADMDGKWEVELREGDVIRIDEPSEGLTSDQAVVMVYHRRYDTKQQWKKLDLGTGDAKLYISRHEEMVNSDEVQENLAELPRHYATLVHEKENWNIEDNNTKFGVYLNSVKIQQPTQLHALDVIRIGDTLFLYNENQLLYNHKESMENNLVIHIEERSVWKLFRKQVLLEDIDLTIRPGEMVLILGGSGAGKTTFVNAVMGYEKARGKIMEGDVDIYRNYNQMKYEIGFVPQQDLLRMEDKVYDTLDNAAQMKMPKNTGKEERTERIKQVLELFGLEREKDSLVVKLSGGQRKRLSIAVEYIADPSLFFLDEPDSGLDGIMARSLMENLRVIADQKKIVLVITHSPDRADDLFDKVIVLAKGNEDNIGHMTFFGSINEARDFFGVDSMEEIVRLMNRVDEGGMGRADEFIKKYREIEER